ncbi:MAG: adenylate/guanylate cyclase domain-containing protein [Caldilineales bacterium]
MTERSQLESAIAALETQRGILGSSAVDAAIAALRGSLAARASTRPSEQRKLVTVLFVDIVGSTSIGEQLDPEDLRDIQSAYFDTVTPVITSYGGAVEKYIGDAVLAVFGVPQAHEDDPKRAVLAALAIHQAIKPLNSQLALAAPGHTLRLRTGIHTGLVMASTGDSLHDFLVTGDAVNRAFRLQELAEPGTVVVSQETHRLVADDFLAEPLPTVAVKGLADKLTAYRVTGLRTNAPRSWTVGGLSSRLVGREAELAVLHNATAQLKRGQGGVAVVIGDAGIGKSRLLTEAFTADEAQGVEILTGRCLSYGNTIPYHLWLDLLRNAARIPPDAPLHVADDQLSAWIETVCPDACDEIYHVLARLLSLTATSSHIADDPPGDSHLSKPALFRAFKTLFRTRSASQPLAIICEDLQWADPSSIELLEQLAKLAEEISLLLVIAFRPDAAQPIWTLVGRLSAAYQQNHISLWLQPLSAADSERMVANLLGSEFVAGGPAAQDVAARSHKLLWRILGRAEGNPYFLEEAIRSLIQSGALTNDGPSGQWRLRSDLDGAAIPRTVQSVLGARIDSLELSTRRVLQVAAVIGRDFSPRVLGAILADEPALDAHVYKLLDQEFIAENSGITGPEYRFTHAMVCEVAYKSLLRTQRRHYHRRVAETLEALAQQGAADVESLALHWQRGGDLVRAAGYLVQSGDRARQIGSSEEAARHYQTALQLANSPEVADAQISPHLLHEKLGDVYLENLSDQEEAWSHYAAFMAGATTDLDCARAARKLASIYVLQGNLPEARVHFEKALALLADYPAAPENNRVRCGLAYLSVSQGNLEQAGVHVRSSVGLARKIGDTRGLADAYRIRGIIADHQGNPRLALAYARRCLPLYEKQKDLPQFVMATNNVADSCRQLGQLRKARAYLRRGMVVARRIGDTREEALLLVTLAEVQLDQGRPKHAIASAQKGLPLAEASGALTRVIQTLRILGLAYAELDKSEEARRHLELALARCNDSGHHRFTAEIHLDLAHLAANSREFTRAEKQLKLAREAIGANPTPAIERKVKREEGFLALRKQNWMEAVAWLEASLADDTPPESGNPSGKRPRPTRSGVHWPSENDDPALADQHEGCKAILSRIGAKWADVHFPHKPPVSIADAKIATPGQPLCTQSGEQLDD